MWPRQKNNFNRQCKKSRERMFRLSITPSSCGTSYNTPEYIVSQWRYLDRKYCRSLNANAISDMHQIREYDQRMCFHVITVMEIRSGHGNCIGSLSVWRLNNSCDDAIFIAHKTSNIEFFSCFCVGSKQRKVSWKRVGRNK